MRESMERGYVGEPPLVQRMCPPEREVNKHRHVHKCPKCGEWVCGASFCKRYAGMRVWCDKHDFMD